MSAAAVAPSVARAHAWVLATLFLLAACVAAAALSSARWPGNAVLALALLAPLLLPLPGLLRSDRRTHGWATLCVTPYLVYGVTESIANPDVRGVAGAILFASLALFVSLVGFLRLTRRVAAPQDPMGS